MNRSRQLTGLLAVAAFTLTTTTASAVIIVAPPPLTVVPGSTSGRIEFATAPLVPSAGQPTFGNGASITNGQVLLHPSGFPALGTFTDVGTASGPLPLISAQAGPSPFGTGQAFVAAGGGGIAFSGGLTDPFDGTATIVASTGRGDFQNTTGNAATYQTGNVIGVSGFVPTGGYIAAAINGFVTTPKAGGGGTMINLTPVIIALNGSGNDFASGSSFSGLSETPVAGGFTFQAYGVSLGPLVTFQPGDISTAQFTLTLFGDPPITSAIFQIDPGVIPFGTPLPNFGGTAVPEPASVALLAMGGLGVLGAIRRRRKSA